MLNIIDYALAKKEWDEAYKHTLEFGESGRNLLVNSESFKLSGTDIRETTEFSYPDEINTVTVVDETGRNWNYYGWLNTIVEDGTFFEHIGETFTLSADFLVNTQAPNSGVRFKFDTRNPSGSIYSEEAIIYNTNGEWVRASVTMTIPDREIQNRSLFLLNQYRTSTNGDTVQFKNVKLERGSRQSGYTPSPIDLDIHPFVARLSEIKYESKANSEDVERLRNGVVSMGGSI